VLESTQPTLKIPDMASKSGECEAGYEGMMSSETLRPAISGTGNVVMCTVGLRTSGQSPYAGHWA
jgi:hypothetical protein